MKLSVIIVNYNGLAFLKNCIESINQCLEGISFEIIFIDNNSTDESCNFICKNYPNINLIRSTENLGFGKGNNEAIKKAKGEFLLLLNNDTVLIDNFLPVLNTLQQDKSIGVIAINMLDGNKKYIQAAGNFPNPKNMFRLKNLLDKGIEFKTGNFSHNIYDVDWLAGSFMMIPRKLYIKIGGFDEDYFMYVEDVDFCKKIANHGYRRVFMPKFSYIHYVGFNNSKKMLLIKGYETYLIKHTDGLFKISCLLALKINKYVKKLKIIFKTI